MEMQSIIGLAIGIAVFAFGWAVQRHLISSAHYLRLVSCPTYRQRHKQVMPLTGGLGIQAAFTFGVLACGILLQPDLLMRFLPLILGGLLIVVAGVMDDLSHLEPKSKLAIQAVAGGIALFSPDVQEFAWRWHETLGWAIWPLIVFWVVGISNAVNLIDGMDGLAGSVSLLTLTALGFGFGVLEGGFGPKTLLAFSLAAAILAFLVFNWHPARTFMGDSGSLTVGYYMAVLAMMQAPGQMPWTDAVVVISTLGYPILDMGWVTVKRISRGFSPFRPDRSHLHYRLLNLDFRVPETVLILVLLHLLFQINAQLFLQASGTTAVLLMIALLSAATLFFVFLGAADRWKVKRVQRTVSARVRETQQPPGEVVMIDLRPIYEAVDLSQKDLSQAAIDGLKLVLTVQFSQRDGFIISQSQNFLYLIQVKGTVDSLATVQIKVKEQVREFLQLLDLPLSFSSLPIRMVESIPRPSDSDKVHEKAA